jgi:hypothetical protein
MFDKGAFNTDEYDPTPELSEILEELHQSESGVMSESQSDYLINQQLPIFIKVLLDRK